MVGRIDTKTPKAPPHDPVPPAERAADKTPANEPPSIKQVLNETIHKLENSRRRVMHLVESVLNAKPALASGATFSAQANQQRERDAIKAVTDRFDAIQKALTAKDPDGAVRAPDDAVTAMLTSASFSTGATVLELKDYLNDFNLQSIGARTGVSKAVLAIAAAYSELSTSQVTRAYKQFKSGFSDTAALLTFAALTTRMPEKQLAEVYAKMPGTSNISAMLALTAAQFQDRVTADQVEEMYRKAPHKRDVSALLTYGAIASKKPLKSLTADYHALPRHINSDAAAVLAIGSAVTGVPIDDIADLFDQIKADTPDYTRAYLAVSAAAEVKDVSLPLSFSVLLAGYLRQVR